MFRLLAPIIKLSHSQYKLSCSCFTQFLSTWVVMKGSFDISGDLGQQRELAVPLMPYLAYLMKYKDMVQVLGVNKAFNRPNMTHRFYIFNAYLRH